MDTGNHLVDGADNEEWLNRKNKPEPEPEYVKCDGCGRDMDSHDHYINGGICYLCISRIGK